MPSPPEVQDVVFRDTPAPTPGATPRQRLRDARRSQAQDRRIGLQHLAFFRGYLEGLALTELADRYLEFGRDARKAASTCAWLITAFVAAARKRQDFATARVLALRPAALAASSEPTSTTVALPSLDEFAADHDPHGFYTEKELLALFHEQFAAPGGDAAATSRRQQRNARLRAKQMAALEALSRLLVEDPKREHHVLGWFDVGVALRLTDVGIVTIGQLVETINAVGYRWYRHVPRLGEIGARRIAAWLEHYRDVPGLTLTPQALTHPSAHAPGVPQLTREAATGIVPLECLRVPAALDGTHGANRNLIKNNSGAHHDLQAIHFWLADYENANTRAKYHTEAERLLLWAIFAKGKALSSLDINDAREYINVFLVNPQPTERWVMHRAVPRHAPAWRPFRGPLALKSRQDALSALKKCFADLVNAQYLDHNAFAKVKVFLGTATDEAGHARRVAAQPRIKAEHALTHEAWAFVMRVLDTLPDSAAAARMRFILILAYSTGLRRAELAGAFTDDIRERYAGVELGRLHLLRVVGKGAKERFIPLVPTVLAALGDYLAARGLPRDPLACPAGTPLIPALPDKRDVGRVRREAGAAGTDVCAALARLARQAKPIHPDQLYKAIKRFFATAATLARREHAPYAQALAQVSPHWLRHTFVSHALAHGMSLESARNFAGHNSLDTTSIYATAEIARQFREAEAFLKAVGGAHDAARLT
ncbi:phage integrase family protein [Pandoraea sputorum]|uniref:Integrase n=1 Tax=Pandoraea sputorum TaxID=93222 RepID=A0A5E5BMF6_9BURK|nr:phage integrase family protein [Pandoraea sputorum]VVE85703.1 integrase [Pandoraea sputorum]